MKSLKILWAEDQPHVLRALTGLIDTALGVVTPCGTGSEALDLLQSETFDLVITDLRMPPGDWGGLWLLQNIIDLKLNVPVIALSGEGSQDETISALRLGAVDYVRKENAPKELRERICKLFESMSAKKSVEDLIKLGENSKLEWKEPMRTNIATGQRDRRMETSLLKTIAAFCNSDGGTLLVGVRDDGSISGIEADNFRNQDAMLLHLDEMVQSRMGAVTCRLIGAKFVNFDGRTVLRIECAISAGPVYVKEDNDNERFYIRRQASTTSLSIRDGIAYITERFTR